MPGWFSHIIFFPDAQPWYSASFLHAGLFLRRTPWGKKFRHSMEGWGVPGLEKGCWLAPSPQPRPMGRICPAHGPMCVLLKTPGVTCLLSGLPSPPQARTHMETVTVTRWGTERKRAGAQRRAQQKRGSGMFAARPAVATGAGARHGRIQARLSRWGTRAGSGASPYPRPVAWTGAGAGSGAVGTAPACRPRWSFRAGSTWAPVGERTSGGCEGRVWWVGELRCAFCRKYSLAAGEAIGPLRVCGETGASSARPGRCSGPGRGGATPAASAARPGP